MYFLFLQFASSFSVLYLGNLCMWVRTELVHLFLLLCSLSLYDYSVVYFIPSLIYYPDKGNLGYFQIAISSESFIFAIMIIYVSRSMFVETGYIMVCEWWGFDICTYSALLDISLLFSLNTVPAVFKHSCFATSFLMLDIIQLLNLCQLCGCRMISHCGFYLHFPIFF